MIKNIAVLLMMIVLTGCNLSPSGGAEPGPSPEPTQNACPVAGCQAEGPVPQATRVPTLIPTHVPATATAPPTPAPTSCQGPGCLVATAVQAVAPEKIPDFSHVIVIVLENREYGYVIGNNQMPALNHFAQENALLTQYYAVTHPSLPNYLAMIAGDTFGITSDCTDCFIDAPSLPDLIEASHRTWKTYQEDLPSPCYVGNFNQYAQKHDPFIYFDPIRNDPARCQRSVVPLTQLDTDLANNDLPNFAFIVPNECNDAHNCGLDVADKWLGTHVGKITSSPAFDQNSLLVVTFDEGQGNHSCCGLGEEAGGQVATLLISPLVKPGAQDNTPYSHYSLLKTIEAAWGLQDLGHSGDPQTALITGVWK